MKALIAYGTRWGSTTDIAKKMSGILTKKGVDVKILNLEKEKMNLPIAASCGVSSYD